MKSQDKNWIFVSFIDFWFYSKAIYDSMYDSSRNQDKEERTRNSEEYCLEERRRNLLLSKRHKRKWFDCVLFIKWFLSWMSVLNFSLQNHSKTWLKKDKRPNNCCYRRHRTMQDTTFTTFSDGYSNKQEVRLPKTISKWSVKTKKEKSDWFSRKKLTTSKKTVRKFVSLSTTWALSFSVWRPTCWA